VVLQISRMAVLVTPREGPETVRSSSSAGVGRGLAQGLAPGAAAECGIWVFCGAAGVDTVGWLASSVALAKTAAEIAHQAGACGELRQQLMMSMMCSAGFGAAVGTAGWR